MELKKYIKSVLVEITTGIKDAQEECGKLGAIINPSMLETKDNRLFIGSIHGKIHVEEIEITVLVEAKNDDGNKKGLGINSGMFSIGVSTTSNNNTDSLQNTLKFKIPIAFPTMKVEKAKSVLRAQVI